MTTQADLPIANDRAGWTFNVSATYPDGEVVEVFPDPVAEADAKWMVAAATPVNPHIKYALTNLLP